MDALINNYDLIISRTEMNDEILEALCIERYDSSFIHDTQKYYTKSIRNMGINTNISFQSEAEDEYLRMSGVSEVSIRKIHNIHDTRTNLNRIIDILNVFAEMMISLKKTKFKRSTSTQTFLRAKTIEF